MNKSVSGRRSFIKQGSLYISAAALTGSLMMCKDSDKGEEKEEKEEEISPAEDLMREHGVLNRVLLVYEDCIDKLTNGIEFAPAILTNAASIIREFIEDYHERQEEEFLFPRFEKAGKLTDLVKTLKAQHQAGRRATDMVKSLAAASAHKDNTDRKALSQHLHLFIRMYRPHEAREDTVLFPALRTIVSKHEYDSMGEDFEKNEHKKFGADGFELYVSKVAELEKQLGINDIAKFTPDI